jgi:hypothetical protein
MRALWTTFLLCATTAACSTYKDDLSRSQHAFEQNRHETALALLRVLERDTSHLDAADQARYAYLRGMTDFRMGYKADARHWLALAKAMDEKSPGSVPSDWRARLDESLAQLDALVWSSGMDSLAVAPVNLKARNGGKKRAPQPKATPSETDEEEEQAPKPPPKKKPADDDD